MLTAGILYDNGQESLDERVKTLNGLVVNNILPALPGDPRGLTNEEEFMAMSLRNK